MPKPKRAALYLRVSTSEQTIVNQRRELEAAAGHRGWTVSDEFRDEGVSGAKGREKRPGLDRLLKRATQGKFDVVMAWSVDRLGRSLPDLVGTMQELHAAKVDLFLHQQALDTTTPSGRAMFQMLGVFAEFERAMIVARVQAGVDRAKRLGTKSGKAIGRPKTPPYVAAKVRELLAAGHSIRKTASIVEISPSTVMAIREAI